MTTGAPVLLKDINDYLRRHVCAGRHRRRDHGRDPGGPVQGAVAAAATGGHTPAGVIWAFGLAGYLGIPLSVVTIAGLPVMLGGHRLRDPDAASIEEEVVTTGRRTPIQEATKNLGPALLVVTFDAISSLPRPGALVKVPMIRDFALLYAWHRSPSASAGSSWPLAILGMREYRSPSKGRTSARATWASWRCASAAPESDGRAPGHERLGLDLRRGHLGRGQARPPERPRGVGQPGEPGEPRHPHPQGRDRPSSGQLGIFVESDDVFNDDVATSSPSSPTRSSPIGPTSC